mmetsp:Transcript_11979/g.17011  ORF Transcript_11979/g.17011 Transcript_11979/m.17011 type:complete len:463 (+) Transcript_11979:284-1672(+)
MTEETTNGYSSFQQPTQPPPPSSGYNSNNNSLYKSRSRTSSQSSSEEVAIGEGNKIWNQPGHPLTGNNGDYNNSHGQHVSYQQQQQHQQQIWSQPGHPLLQGGGVANNTNAPKEELQPLNASSGYGSTAQHTASPPHVPSNMNASGRRPPASSSRSNSRNRGRTYSGENNNASETQPFLTPEQQAFEALTRGGMSGGGRSSSSGNHRRTYSDGRGHRRTGSASSTGGFSPTPKLGGGGGSGRSTPLGGGLLPPQAPRLNHHRARSFSGGYNSHNGSIRSASPLRLVRNRSESDFSVASGVSVGSVVTDITKSAMFKGVTESGKVVFHTPLDKIHLVMDDELRTGNIYKLQDEDYNANLDTLEDDYHYLEYGGQGCNCHCDNCKTCNSKQGTVPPARYLLAVDSDLYKRVLEEISDSKTMPCKLFYCGHHEDIDHPSIMIATTMVLVTFGLMIYVAWAYGITD